jgi:hypothetical protein
VQVSSIAFDLSTKKTRQVADRGRFPGSSAHKKNHIKDVARREMYNHQALGHGVLALIEELFVEQSPFYFTL